MDDEDPSLERRRRLLATKIMRIVTRGDEDAVTAVPGLILLRRSQPSPPEPVVHETGLSVIVRGRTRVLLGSSSFSYDESRFLVTAMDVPTVTQVLLAEPAQPYLAIFFKLDIFATQQMIADIDVVGPSAPVSDAASRSAMMTGATTAELLDAIERLVDLIDAPQDVPVLAELIHREILYRILVSSAGVQLRQAVSIATARDGIAHAVTWLKENYHRPFRASELARESGMSVQTLYRRFHAVTQMSPLQFQKRLRLHEARRLMLAEDLDALTVSMRVGYESAAQFSREYKRLFGAPPRRHIESLRATSS
ncbi:MAG: AraC family transcriptional regulator [Actinomyces sp.]|nr:AraC family transcriptional regulator [Actinomyces sp.]MCI1788523.1 AraC family transcriptional regulator [Actinomyces sp.]